MADADDKTEAATARRVQRARDEGQAAVSPELSGFLLLAGLAALLSLRLPDQARALYGSLAGLMGAAGSLDGAAAIAAALHRAGAATLRAVIELFGLAVLAAAAAALGQTGFLFNVGALAPDLARLSPGRGLRRVFSAAGLIGAGKSLIKLAIIFWALWRLLSVRLPGLGAALWTEPSQLPAALADLIAAILLTILSAQALIAVADLVLVRARHGKSLRMSREELRDEQRESDGDPQIKARMKRLRAQRARHRMAQAVRRATVVVTNPTHYAVALTYDRARNAAPRVVAKGVDEAAARIRAAAAEHGVPIVANPPLARALHLVELDSDIPPEHYQVVAELIAYVWRLQGQARRTPAG